MINFRIEPIKNPDHIINYWKKEKAIVACIIIFGLSFNSAMILGPIYQGKLIDALTGGKSLSDIVKAALVFVVLILGIQILRYYKRFFIRRFANSTGATMRLMIYHTIMRKSVSELQDENTGDLMTRAISDVELCVEGMRKFTTEIFDTGVLMVSYLITMSVYDLKITAASVCLIPVAMLLAEKLKVFIYRYSKVYRSKSSEVTDITFDIIENAMLYRISGMESDNRMRYNENLTDLQEKAIKANILENSMQPIYNVIAMAGIIPVIYLGGSKVIAGGWTVGEFSAFITIFAAMAVKASKASKLFNSVQKSQVSWKRIKPYLSDYQSKDMTSQISLDDTELSVKNLTFSYNGEMEHIIKNINLSANRGEIVGVTGPIASGKSTLGIALTGLYPYIGSIMIDGKELKDYSEYERSKMISYMGHDPELLSDSIYRNITLGKDRDIDEVLKDVCFDEDLKNMPQGQNTLVGNGGVRLSGGQQARISLARALLNKNKVIILDDPFSAVDMKTEKMIMENIREHYKKSIIVLISHRLAIFPELNHIIFMHVDKTWESGSHCELMSKSGLYADIFNLQKLEGEDCHEEKHG